MLGFRRNVLRLASCRVRFVGVIVLHFRRSRSRINTCARVLTLVPSGGSFMILLRFVRYGVSRLSGVRSGNVTLQVRFGRYGAVTWVGRTYANVFFGCAFLLFGLFRISYFEIFLSWSMLTVIVRVLLTFFFFVREVGTFFRRVLCPYQRFLAYVFRLLSEFPCSGNVPNFG